MSLVSTTSAQLAEFYIGIDSRRTPFNAPGGGAYSDNPNLNRLTFLYNHEMFSFTPVLWVDQTAPTGDYWAEFRLTDLSGSFGNSGRFFIDVRNVPEPGSLALAGLAIVGLLAKRS